MKKIIYVISGLAVIGLFILGYFQIKKPLIVEGCNYVISDIYTNIMTLDDIKNIYENEVTDQYTQHIRKNNVFPSDDVGDYCNIVINVDLKNWSVLNQNEIKAILKVPDPENSIIISTEAAVSDQNIKRFSEDTIYAIHLYIYKGNMTDDEVIEEVSKSTIKLYYLNKLTSRNTITFELKDYDIEVTHE